MKNDTPPTRLIPLAEWPKHHPWPTAPALRFYHYNGKLNGFEAHGVVKRIGRRILIDESAFFRWVDSNSNHTAHLEKAQVSA